MSPLSFSADFTATDRDSFLADLGSLCPSAKFSIDGAGSIVWDGDPTCGEYCDHPVACNLVRCVLLPAPGNPVVKIRWSDPRYIPNCPTIPGAYTLWWKPKAKPVELAHELIHICHDYDKTLDCYDNVAEESCTTCGENQVRAELKLPDRTYYFTTNTGEPIPLECEDLGKYGGCLPLSDADELGCGCGGGISIGPFELPSDKVIGWLDQLVEAMKKVFGPKRPVQPSPWPGPEARRSREEFRSIIDRADPTVVRLLESADSMRRRFRGQLRLQPAIEEFFRNAQAAVMVESVRLLEPSYSILAVADTDEGPQLLTNVSLSLRPVAFVGATGPAERYALSDTFGGRTQRLVSGPLDGVRERAGGVPQVLDGGTKFLTIKGAETTRAALYGYFYEGFDPTDEQDLVQADDEQAWLATQRAVAFWREAVAEIVRPI